MPDPRAILVTGGSRGIGAAICRRLAAAGHPVCVNYAAGAPAAEAVAADIRARGGRAATIAADVSDPDAVARMFDAAEQALGPLGGLVNNAGIIGGTSRVDALPPADLARVLQVNVAGAFLCAQQAVRRLSTAHGGAGGAIVNLGSVASRLGSPGEFVHYAMTKGAIDTFTTGLAREVAAEGIRVNAVAPGLIATDMNPQERQDRHVGTIPARRVGQPEEIAEAVAWLISDAASYVNGTILTVSGGR
jgi:NAD(P)-dependent dehydrogenase (short-subunit alcohol dehydrogenase family)